MASNLESYKAGFLEVGDTKHNRVDCPPTPASLNCDSIIRGICEAPALRSSKFAAFE